MYKSNEMSIFFNTAIPINTITERTIRSKYIIIPHQCEYHPRRLMSKLRSMSRQCRRKELKNRGQLKLRIEKQITPIALDL